MTSTTPPRRQIHLGAHFPGVNSTTVWADPRSGSQIDFRSFEHLARSAERAKLDFFFLAEGLRLREYNGLIHDLDVVGRPDTFTVLAALAAVTDKLGLAGTINSTFNEPFDVARQFASLDHLSAGRAGDLADLLLDWQSQGISGFRLRPAELPYDLEQITRALVPELQRRGAFRTSYDHDTLRARLGLPRPANRFAA